MGKERKNRIFLISDITKARLKIRPEHKQLSSYSSQFSINFKVNGRSEFGPQTFFHATADDVAKEIYDYIARNNTNIPPFVPSVAKGPKGPRFLRFMGVLHIIFGGALTMLMLIFIGVYAILQGAISPVIILSPFPILILITGIFGVLKSNVQKASTIRVLTIVNFFLFEILVRGGGELVPTPLVLTGRIILILMFIAAQINCMANKKLRQQEAIHIQESAEAKGVTDMEEFAEAEGVVNPRNFTVHYKRHTMMFNSLILLGIGFMSYLVISSFVTAFGGSLSANIAILILFGPMICEIIYSKTWRCTVEEDKISYRSVFRRKVINVHDIKRVSPKRVKMTSKFGGDEGFLGINLYSESGKKLFHVGSTKQGFRDFIIYLENNDVSGAEEIPKGTR
jgi:hypothetical protein